MAKKRTCCIGWTKGLQRMKAQILSMAPAVGPDEAGRLLGVMNSIHRGRVQAIRARNAETKNRQRVEPAHHIERRLTREWADTHCVTFPSRA